MGSSRFATSRFVRLYLPAGESCLLYLAERFRTRLLGLTGMARPPGDGLLLPRCSCIHTLGMRFPIDVVFLSWPPENSGRVRVLDLRRHLPPGRVAALRIAARMRKRVAVVELVGGRTTSLGLEGGIELLLAPYPAT